MRRPTTEKNARSALFSSTFAVAAARSPPGCSGPSARALPDQAAPRARAAQPQSNTFTNSPPGETEGLGRRAMIPAILQDFVSHVGRLADVRCAKLPRQTRERPLYRDVCLLAGCERTGRQSYRGA